MFGSFCFVSAFNIINLGRELAFYRRVDWDFSIDSGIGSGAWSWGEGQDPMTNRSRVLYARPFCIAIVLVFLAFSASTFFSPGSWTRIDRSDGITWQLKSSQ